MRREESFDRWLEYGEEGFVSGIREDAPDEAKKDYAEFLKEEEKRREQHIKI